MRDAALEQTAVQQTPIGPQAALGAGQSVENTVVQPAARLTVDLAAMHLDAKGVRLRNTVVTEAFRTRDDVILTLVTELAGEGVSTALHAVQLGLERLRLRLASLCRGLSTDHVLGTAKRQHISQLCCVDYQLRMETDQARVVQIHRDDGDDEITLHLGSHCLASQVHRQAAGEHMRLQHSL